MTTPRRISCRASAEPLASEWLGVVEYLDAWERQRKAAASRADGHGGDVVLLLEHPSVYTAGRRTQPHERPTDGTPVIDVDRGGLLTWHGPGQLVGYPIIGLAEPIDVVDYVRRLEEALIAVVAGLGVPCGRVEGRSGVWVGADARGPERKIAAIGVRVVRGVTMHGFSLNCDPDLRAYDTIVPCGLTDVGVTSLAAETGHPVTVADVLPDVTEAVEAAIDGRLPVAEHAVPRASKPVGLTLALDPALG